MKIKYKNGIWKNINETVIFDIFDVVEIEWGGIILYKGDDPRVNRYWYTQLKSGESVYVWYNDKPGTYKNWTVKWLDNTWGDGETLYGAIVDCNLKIIKEVENS